MESNIDMTSAGEAEAWLETRLQLVGLLSELLRLDLDALEVGAAALQPRRQRRDLDPERRLRGHGGPAVLLLGRELALQGFPLLCRGAEQLLVLCGLRPELPGTFCLLSGALRQATTALLISAPNADEGGRGGLNGDATT